MTNYRTTALDTAQVFLHPEWRLDNASTDRFVRVPLRGIRALHFASVTFWMSYKHAIVCLSFSVCMLVMLLVSICCILALTGQSLGPFRYGGMTVAAGNWPGGVAWELRVSEDTTLDAVVDERHCRLSIINKPAVWTPLIRKAEFFGITMVDRTFEPHMETPPMRIREITIPSWVAAGLPLIPAFCLARRPVRRFVRRRRGQCVYCGYDLRGSISGRCPECGKANTAFKTLP